MFEQMKEYQPGRSCIVNGSGDLAFEHETRNYIGNLCFIVKVTKHGLVQVRKADCSGTISVPKRNVDLCPVPYVLRY